MLRATILALILLIPQVVSADNPAIFLITPTSGEWSGTGFKVHTKHGDVSITNAHVCGKETEMFMEHDKRLKLLIVKKVYKNHDLCLLTPAPGIPALKLAEDYYKEEPVMVEGYPMGVHAISWGTTGRYFSSNIEKGVMVEYIGFVNPGNSGSPVQSSDGRVIGVIATKGVMEGKDIGGMVPLEHLKEFLGE